jgi:hypothetical protein
MHVFNAEYRNIFKPTIINEENLPNLLEKLNSIYIGGLTNLAKGIDGIKKYLNDNTQVIIITDGDTSYKDKAIEEFKLLKNNNSVLLIGYGKEYSYSDCIELIEGDSTIFCEALLVEDIMESIYKYIGAGIRLEIEHDKKTINFINYVIQYRFIYNGLPSSIKLYLSNDIINVELKHDSKLDKISKIAYYESLINNYIKNLSNDLILEPSGVLNCKMLLKEVKKRIDSDKNIIGINIYNRLLNFITGINESCYTILKESHYGYLYNSKLSRENSNSIARRISNSFRESFN